MMKKNKTQLIISSLVILFPMFVGIIMWNMLPDSIVTHWGADGVADGWSSKAFAVFGLPGIMLVLHWFCAIVTAHDPKNKNQSDKAFGMVLWILPIMSLLTCGTVYALALGSEISIDIAVRVLLGLLFVILGNYMPKCRQNYTIGIKIKWTLINEENWNKTHRFAGRLWVFGGVLLLSTMFVPLKNFVGAFIGITLLLAFVPMIYSYAYYRKQLKEGTVKKGDTVDVPLSKKGKVMSAITAIIILAFVGIMLFTGDFDVQFEENSFTIDASYWENAKVNYADIDNIEYREQDDPGRRVLGFGSSKLLLGEFENDEFGSYTRYSYTKCDSCVVLSVGDRILVINGENDESTKQLYDELTKRVDE